MFAIRGPFAALGGAFVAGTLFLGLSQLVSVPFEAPERIIADRVVFRPQRVDTKPQSKRDEKVVRELPTVEPKGPPLIVDDFGDESATTLLKPARPEVEVDRDGSGVFLAGVDGDVLPIVRVNPDYPPAAIIRNIEGWVQVRFTVTAIGTVRDAVVVDSEPGTVFADAALKAIARWRYNPRVVNGEAVERVGLQTVFRFELEN
jgi:protein TonB